MDDWPPKCRTIGPLKMDFCGGGGGDAKSFGPVNDLELDLPIFKDFVEPPPPPYNDPLTLYVQPT